MKKVLLSGIFSLTLLISNAQYTKTSNSGFGVKGGANFTNLITGDVNENNLLTSFNVGVFALLSIGSFITFQPELNFSRKGAELVYDNIFAEGTAEFRLNYLEVPLLLKVNLIRNFNIHAGPYAAYLISTQVKNETTGGNFDFEDNFDSKDFNRLDYGLALGVVGLGARYNYGLANIGKERSIGGVSYVFPDSKNSALNVYDSFKF